MEPTNEPSPADGDRKLESQVHDSFDKEYAELLKKDQDAMEAKIRGESVTNYENVRKLGFATMRDIEEKIKESIGKYASEVQSLRDENTKLREWVMRAKTQGLNSGAGDEGRKEPSVLDKYRRPFS